jgi:hypothetical protein
MTLSIDLGQLVTAIAAQVAEPLRAVIRDEIRSAGVERAAAALQPLATILDVSPAAARMRLKRDPALRDVGLRAGRRLLFRRADVEALLAARTRDACR